MEATQFVKHWLKRTTNEEIEQKLIRITELEFIVQGDENLRILAQMKRRLVAELNARHEVNASLSRPDRTTE